MVAYRRNDIEGGTFFFTVALHDRHSDLLVRHIDALRAAYNAVAVQRPFRTEAIAILPEHLHAIWTLPRGDAAYGARWRAIKSGFVRRLTRTGVDVARNARGEADVWQRRFWEHTLRDESDFRRHVDYIHYNPVKHGHSASASEWPYSSFHRFVARGDLPSDWGAPQAAGDLSMAGEPQ